MSEEIKPDDWRKHLHSGDEVTWNDHGKQVACLDRGGTLSTINQQSNYD